jgi:hypothetical protein
MPDLDHLDREITEALSRIFDASDRDRWCKDRKYRTVAVKKALGDLGHKLSFEVCASGYSGAEEGEWLYDMSWCTLDRTRNGILISQPMVLESEWSPDPLLDGDFQKLVQARADIRVWVFAADNLVEVKKYIERCREQARAFTGRSSGDRYLCAGFDWLTKTFLIESFQVS